MARKETAANAEALRGKIEERAHSIWEAEGKPHGCNMDHWLKAEAEVFVSRSAGPTGSSRKSSAGSTTRQKKT